MSATSCISKVNEFNQTVSVDLNYLKRNLWHLQMTDGFTRFTAGEIIPSKAVATKAFMQHWIVIFGSPMKIFSDIRGEFIGTDSFTNVHEKLNISLISFIWF